MQNEKIYIERVKRFIQRQKEALYEILEELETEYIKADEPIPYSELANAQWQKIAPKEVWNKVWGSAWFRVKGSLSKGYPAAEQGLYFDCEGEACVMKEGTPYQGLTPKVDWYHNAAKHYVPLAPWVDDNGDFCLYIEGAANDLFGAGKEEYRLAISSLCRFDEERYQFALDLELLLDLANALPEKTTRRERILYGLNEICNVYAADYQTAQRIAKKLLASPANASALKAYSVGHAHLDLAWLWPIRESRRKGGRSFANALRLLELYPDYIFGASQAQLYQWIKDDYPELYKEIKEAVKEGRWEVQGASWTEFDTNVPSGESIIRQFMYGKRFFKEEFGIEPNYLWLPDCFGFSANLPQLLKGCGVDFFITQKLSWNETNVFDKHLFNWEGIDGSRVYAHQLPTNDYNFANSPSQFIATETRFTQAAVAEGYLNLYGIGDGGGGPTRNHIEYGLRQKDLEGSHRVIFSKAERFFAEYAKMDMSELPMQYGEMYLELHRGTYTTQGKMKRDNYDSEGLLTAAEWIAALSGLLSGKLEYPDELRPIWQDTLLLQFHDILPGSSITKVYEDSRQMCEKNHKLLKDFIAQRLNLQEEEGCYTVINPYPVDLNQWHSFPLKYKDSAAVLGDIQIERYRYTEDEMQILLYMPPFGVGQLYFDPEEEPYLAACERLPITEEGILIENDEMQILVNHRGGIESIVRFGYEYLSEESNRLLLWEDEPNNWGAWDINHFYRETVPQEVKGARLLEAYRMWDYCLVKQELFIGNSRIIQKIELMPEYEYILISHEVDWQEHHQMLQVGFSSKIHCQDLTCGVQMGSVKRSARFKNAWEAARFVFPAQGFVAQSEAGRTCAVLSGAKYGWSAQENTIELALLRSPADVDPTADIGTHHYSYGFYFDELNIDEAPLNHYAKGIDRELLIYEGKSELADMDIPLYFEHLQLNSIKPAEDGKGVIVRLYEPLGRHVMERIYPFEELKSVCKCNHLEEPLQLLNIEKAFMVKPFEIITLRMEFEHDTLSG